MLIGLFFLQENGTAPDITGNDNNDNNFFLHVLMFSSGRVITPRKLFHRSAVFRATCQSRQCVTMSNIETGKKAAAFAAVDENIKVFIWMLLFTSNMLIHYLNAYRIYVSLYM